MSGDQQRGTPSPCLPAGRLPSLPFTVVDEAVHVLDTPQEPWSIQFELRVAGHLDEPRLRAAMAEALRRHPMARARMAPPRRFSRRYCWEITPEPELDPLRVLDCPDDATLAVIRSELQSLGVPLAESPPLRARLVRHPDGDLLMLNVNHAAFDGFGSLRVLHSVARAYAGRPDPLPQVPLEDARDVRGHLTTDDLAVRAPRWQMLADKLRDLLTPPARVAPDEGADRPGYGFHHLRLSADDTAALSDSELPGTVNDLLVAALHLAVVSWNAEHGAPCHRIGVLVPVNLRPDAWRQDVATNFVLSARVVTSPRARATPRQVLDTVAAQGAQVRGDAGAALIEVLWYTPLLPVWAKQQLPTLLWLTGNRLVDTALLSNLVVRAEKPVAFGCVCTHLAALRIA
ncbi:MAG: condensation domain-containing protein [Egibacteraceae bacterium]